MLSIRVDDEVYGLDDASADELVGRLEATRPADDDASLALYDRLRSTLDDAAPLTLDDAHLAVVGVVLEAWAVEVDGDLPPDLQELRYAIASRLG